MASQQYSQLDRLALLIELVQLATQCYDAGRLATVNTNQP